MTSCMDFGSALKRASFMRFILAIGSVIAASHRGAGDVGNQVIASCGCMNVPQRRPQPGDLVGGLPFKRLGMRRLHVNPVVNTAAQPLHNITHRSSPAVGWGGASSG